MNDHSPLGKSIASAPRIHDRDAAARLRESWGAKWRELENDEAVLIEGVAGCSPFLGRIMLRAPELALEVLRASPADNLAQGGAMAKTAIGASSPEEAMRALRRAKRKAALAIALADIAGARATMEAARDVSVFADACVDAALGFAARRTGVDKDAGGIGVIAMGKLGAFELNYSSDIDLVVIYDADAMGCDPVEAKTRAVRAARDMVALLQNQTADGYVFRTDLRLRPDPGVSPLALSVQAAEAYYESFGQNWERMAYIKARASAGDITVGEKFLAVLRPFVWRKYLDFAAIADVKAVKRQIHSSKGGGAIEFAGHDIKTGRGGIREIEFFAQTQQIILGGKDPALRLRSTLAALQALEQQGHITSKQHTDLAGDYLYLRHVEHRLQMINDEQTHRIPKLESDIERAAAFSGADSVDAFREKMTATLSSVQDHYDELFREDAEEFEQPGPLVFTGVEADADTIETLSGLGFKRAEEISRVIRRWHRGGLRATKSERARAILTRLMAPLLTALSRANDPDAAFFAFDEFLSRLPAGVQVFSLLANNVALFDTLIEIMTISPFLGREMSKRANFVEALLEHGLVAELPAIGDYAPALARAVAGAVDYEQTLNLVRRWAGEERFFVAARLAAGKIGAQPAAAHLSAIADAAIAALTPAARGEMERLHGPIAGELVVLAMGRLGAGEMTIASDIDILFVYDAPDGAASQAGDGRRELAAGEYFSRLVRRLVTALSAATEEGALYEVDMALRPSGRAGPAAVSFAAFRRYYAEDAWTWEIMALTKARIVTGDKALSATVKEEIGAILTRVRGEGKTAENVNDMRARLLQAKPGAGPWDVKLVRGGLTDIAFIIEYLALVHAARKGRAPGRLGEAISWLERRALLSSDQARDLAAANDAFDNVLHVARAATGAGFDPDQAGAGLARRMAGICGVETLAAASETLQNHQARVMEIYRQIIGRDPEGGKQA